MGFERDFDPKSGRNFGEEAYSRTIPRIGPYGAPRGGSVSYERGNPVVKRPLHERDRGREEASSPGKWLKPRPESGLDCLMCAIFARQRGEGGTTRGGAKVSPGEASSMLQVLGRSVQLSI